MQPHDAYFIAGVFIPIYAFGRIFSARADDVSYWMPFSLFLAGIGCLAIAWIRQPDALNFDGFMQSVLRLLNVFASAV
ncbi:MAG: hypothetical protein COB84_05040 [Rhodobacteraceae bacterium]|nr:MAG: hypothetical protein COB84_05040 [Paracoccaceae bacterium]